VRITNNNKIGTIHIETSKKRERWTYLWCVF